MTNELVEKNRKVITFFVLPLLLCLYAFTGLREGVDVADTTFSLVNYTYPEKLNAMWRFAFYLPNVIGQKLAHLPFGDTLYGMNVYATVFVALTAVAA
ncbi:MAG: hypothetical protein IJR58_08520, partial [Lachnospiraceae bacterium]|nr:hypothetical protein [Lachnospiraceae bacterium]